MINSKSPVDYDLLARNNRYFVKHPAGHSTKELVEFFGISGFILDLGTGAGRHAYYLKEKGFVLVGLDISIEHLKKSPLKKLVCADANRLPFKERVFDCVLCSEVLEHLKEPENCLKEIRQILKDTGFACFTTPYCDLPLRSVVIPLYRKLAGIKLEPGEHIRVFSRDLLSMVGKYFRIERVRYVDFTAVLKWRFSKGYFLDHTLSKFCEKLPLLKYFAGNIFIKAALLTKGILSSEEIKEKSSSWDRRWKRFRGQTLIGRFYQNQVKGILSQLINNLIPDKDLPILDFGCGVGRTLSYFKEWGFKNIKGLDVSLTALEICQQKGFQINKDIFLADSEHSNFKDGEFFLIFSEGLLEHYQDFSPIVNEMARLSCRYIMLMQPNHFSFFGRVLNLLTGLFSPEKKIKEISHPISKFISYFEVKEFCLKKRRETVLGEFTVLLLERKHV